MKKTVTAKKLRELTAEELARKERDLRQELLNLRVQQQSGKIENPIRLRTLRREVARIRAVQGERTRAAAGASA